MRVSGFRDGFAREILCIIILRNWRFGKMHPCTYERKKKSLKNHPSYWSSSLGSLGKSASDTSDSIPGVSIAGSESTATGGFQIPNDLCNQRSLRPPARKARNTSAFDGFVNKSIASSMTSSDIRPSYPSSSKRIARHVNDR